MSLLSERCPPVVYFLEQAKILGITWANWVCGYVGNNATFLHVIAQELENAQSWNLAHKCSLE